MSKSDDLISRQAAIDEIQSVYDFEYPTASGAFDEFVTMIIPNIIKNMPSAQSECEEGEWLMLPDPYGVFDKIPVCSKCGCTTKMREKYKYCPNCGVKMKERQEE